MTQKIVINASVGGFSVSRKAFHRLAELKNPVALADLEYIEENEAQIIEDFGPEQLEQYGHYPLLGIKRDDCQLIQVIEELGVEAFEKDRCLKIIEIPDNIKWYIVECENGIESVHEEHRVWT